MKSTQIIAISIRLFSIWLFAQSFMLILTTAQSMAGQSKVYYAYPSFLILISIFLWNFPLTISNKIIPNKDEDDHISNIDTDRFVRGGVIILGLILLSDAITAVGSTILSYHFSEQGALDPSLPFDIRFRIFKGIIGGVIGATLIAKNHSFSRILK